jgi:hypothetical protein
MPPPLIQMAEKLGAKISEKQIKIFLIIIDI